MVLYFYNETKNRVARFEKIYNDIFNETIKKLHKKGEFITSVTFVDKEKIHQINKVYRKIDRPTDVISFAFLDDKTEIIKGNLPIDLGEIYICYDVAKENAKSYKNTLNRELSFLFVHGLLHLFGYDHMTKEDEDVMFPLQEKILEKVKYDKRRT